MRKFVSLALLFCSFGFSFSAGAANDLLSRSFLYYPTGQTEVYVLRDDGYVYLQRDLCSEEKVARVQNTEQLMKIEAAINEVPVDATLRELTDAEKETNAACDPAGEFQVKVYGWQFPIEGTVINQSIGCFRVGIVGPKAYIADALVRLIDSVDAVPHQVLIFQ